MKFVSQDREPNQRFPCMLDFTPLICTVGQEDRSGRYWLYFHLNKNVCEGKGKGWTWRSCCPYFVKLHKREFSFLITSHFEYISPHSSHPSAFSCSREKHHTIDLAWTFSSLFAFSADRSVFGGNIDFCFPSTSTPLLATFACLSSWGTWNNNKKKMMLRRCWIELSAEIYFFTTKSPTFNSGRLIQKALANRRRDISFSSIMTKRKAQGKYCRVNNDLGRDVQKEWERKTSTKRTIETFYVMSFLS